MRWATIVDYPNYEVSDTGIVRRKPGNLKPIIPENGYPMVVLGNGRGERKNLYIHRLVADAFLPAHSSNANEVAHWDNDKRNNNVGNLRWATRAENEADKARHGTKCEGEAHHSAKLTLHLVAQARALRGRGYKFREIADRFGVSLPTIYNAITGVTWAATTSSAVAQAEAFLRKTESKP